MLCGSLRRHLYPFTFWLTRDPTLADDVVQETLLRAWSNFDSLTDERAARAWLLTIARRESLGQPMLVVRSRPGMRHSYSNIGYTLAGMVIETVTGSRYEAYLGDQLLPALGMHDSTFAFTTQVGATGDPRIAMGHFERGSTHASVPTRLRPAGQLTTTAGDMARLARFLMGDGRIDGRPFIDQRLLGAMAVPAGTEAVAAGLRVGYALGLYARDRHGAVGKCQGGSTVGFHALLCLYPEHQKAFFLSINTDSETAQYDRFHGLIIDALEVGGTTGSEAPFPSDDPGLWEGYYLTFRRQIAWRHSPGSTPH